MDLLSHRAPYPPTRRRVQGNTRQPVMAELADHVVVAVDMVLLVFMGLFIHTPWMRVKCFFNAFLDDDQIAGKTMSL